MTAHGTGALDIGAIYKEASKRGANGMKAFIIACVAAIIIAAIGGFALNTVQKPADQAFSTSAVRLGA